MKRLFAIIFLLTIGYVTPAAMAQTSTTVFHTAHSTLVPPSEPFFQASISSDSASFILRIDNPQSRMLNLQISQSGTGMLLDTLIVSTHHACRYHFTEVNDGQFEVVIRYGKSKWVRKVLLTTYQKEERLVTVE